jgi:tol-pal system protein YbgF
MVAVGTPPKMSKAMIRSVSLLALAGMLWTGAARAQMSDADMVTRIDHLEAQIREMTGTIEQLQYRNQQLEQEVQRLQAGGAPAANAGAKPPYAPSQAQQYPSGPQYPAQPATAQYTPPSGSPYPAGPQYSPPRATYSSGVPAPIVAAEPSMSAPIEPTSSSGHHGDAFDPTRNPNAPGAPRPLGAPGVAAAEPPPAVYNTPVSGPQRPGVPLDLSSPSTAAPAGALPPPPPSNPNATGAMQAALPPSNTPKDEFDLGYGYVLHKDYALAVQTLRDFLQKYPSDRLTPDAQYWLGEALFQQQHYRDAAESFLAVSTKYETTARAPEALLRLGQSLAALGEKEAACASLGEVLRKYPRASATVKQGVDREQKRVHC